VAFWPDFYTSKRTLWTKDGQNRDLVFQSGYAVFNLKGTGQTWHGDQVWILTDAVWTPTPAVDATASLASISNEHTAVDAGWATDALNTALYNNRILLQVDLAIRDIDGWLHRVAYHVTAVGKLGGWPA
jgi:hypothetical protein